MSKNIQLTIADPCHENWDQMEQAEQGRYCASCQKQVMDFTNMSDSQLATFFKKPSQASVCGRFYNDQLERDIEIPKKRIPWVKYFFQFALPAFLMSAKASAQGKVCVKKENVAIAPPVPIMLGQVSIPLKRAELLQKIFIKGKIVDENNNPIPFATVMIKGTLMGTSADSIGIFKMEGLNLQAETILSISSVGYRTKEITIPGNNEFTKDMVIQLSSDTFLGEVVAVSAYSNIRMGGVMGGVIIKKTVKDRAETKPPTELPPMIKVYPNPVLSGTNINVGCQKLKEGYYSVQISNLSGQQVLNKQTWIDAEAQVLNIDIPTVVAGVYFLKLANKETNKRFTAKIVIQ